MKLKSQQSTYKYILWQYKMTAVHVTYVYHLSLSPPCKLYITYLIDWEERLALYKKHNCH